VSRSRADRQDILLVDVRERDENALGSIPSAVNLPLSELKEALGEEYNPGDFQSVSPTSSAWSRGVASR